MNGENLGGGEMKPSQKPVYFDGSGSAPDAAASQSATANSKAAITPEARKNLGGNPYFGTSVKK